MGAVHSAQQEQTAVSTRSLKKKKKGKKITTSESSGNRRRTGKGEKRRGEGSLDERSRMKEREGDREKGKKSN